MPIHRPLAFRLKSPIDGKGIVSRKKAPEIHCYDYVNHSYQRVRDALREDAVTVFRSATKSAVSRAHSIATELQIDFGGIGIMADIEVRVKSVEEKLETIPSPVTSLLLEWQAKSMPGLFPFMRAEFAIYPLTPNETQLDFLGYYEPPFGMVGKAMNAIVFYRIAEVSVHRFVSDVAGYLRQTLNSQP